MSTSAVSTSASSPSFVNDSTTTGIRSPKKVLDQSDFLKLLAVQFSTQDPMKPMEDTAFIAQMAQFSSLEQANQTRKDQQMLTSNGYLGRSVTVQDSDGKLFTGLVTAVDNSGSAPALVINGTNYPLSSVKRIEVSGNGTTTTPPPTDTTTPSTVQTSEQFPQLYNLIRDRIAQGLA